MGTFSSTANFIAQSTDPGALGAGAIWSDTDAELTYRRNDANSEWVALGNPTSQATFPTASTKGALFHSTASDSMHFVTSTSNTTDPRLFRDVANYHISRLSDDFSSYADQTAFDNAYSETGTEFSNDPAGNQIDFNLTADTVDHFVSYDLANTISNYWVLRMEVDITAVNNGGNQAVNFFMGLASSPAEAGTSRDFLGHFMQVGNSVSRHFGAASGDGVAMRGSVTGTQMAHSAQVETFYIEMIRNNNSFSTELFSDSSFSTSIEAETDTDVSAQTDLRYFWFGRRDDLNDTLDTANITGTINSIEFYDGVITV